MDPVPGVNFPFLEGGVVDPDMDKEGVGRGDIGFRVHPVIFSGDERFGEGMILVLVAGSVVSFTGVEEEEVEGCPFT
jgi:hypothetical protein